MMENKTNVMRILDRNHIPYIPHYYSCEKNIFKDGYSVAESLGQDPSRVFKTLVTHSLKENYVFVIPVNTELDLRKAAKAVGVKSVSMLHLSDLTSTTGYIRGGCSPVGMKKSFPTVFHNSALQFETIIVSAGKIGSQVEIEPQALACLVKGTFANIVLEESEC